MTQSPHRLISFDVRSQRVGFLVLEPANRVLNFGVKRFDTGAAKARTPARQRLEALLRQFQPDVVVLRNSIPRTIEGYATFRAIMSAVGHFAKDHDIKVVGIRPRQIREAFPGCRNKYEVAAAVFARLPDLSWEPPVRRKCYEPEDPRMSIFDAAAVAMAYLDSAGKPKPSCQ